MRERTEAKSPSQSSTAASLLTVPVKSGDSTDTLLLRTLFPSVRPRSHSILSQRVFHILLTGVHFTDDEWFFDEDNFLYNISLITKPSLGCASSVETHSYRSTQDSYFIVLRVTCPCLTSLWNCGAKELVSHFFPGSASTLESIKTLEGLGSMSKRDSTTTLPSKFHACYPDAPANEEHRACTISKVPLNETHHQSVLRLDVDVTSVMSNLSEAGAMGQKIGNIRFLLLLGPVFKHLRRAIYSTPTLNFEPRIRLYPAETVWILPSPTEFSITVRDHRPVPWTSAYQTFVADVANRVTMLLAGESCDNPWTIPSMSGSRARRMSHLASKIGPQLRFRYLAGTPTPDIREWCLQHNYPVPCGGHWLHFNMLRFRNTSETELLSIAKIIVGLRRFLDSGFRHQQQSMRLEIKAAALEISSLARVP